MISDKKIPVVKKVRFLLPTFSHGSSSYGYPDFKSNFMGDSIERIN